MNIYTSCDYMPPGLLLDEDCGRKSVGQVWVRPQGTLVRLGERWGTVVAPQWRPFYYCAEHRGLLVADLVSGGFEVSERCKP